MGENRAHRVQIRYFAWVREKVGCESENVELPANIQTVADLVGWLKQRGPQYGERRSLVGEPSASAWPASWKQCVMPWRIFSLDQS